MRLIGICVFLAACGVKDKEHDARVYKPVCIDDLDHSPAMVRWPDGVVRKSMVYICDGDVSKYCVDTDECFFGQ